MTTTTRCTSRPDALLPIESSNFRSVLRHRSGDLPPLRQMIDCGSSGGSRRRGVGCTAACPALLYAPSHNGSPPHAHPTDCFPASPQLLACCTAQALRAELKWPFALSTASTVAPSKQPCAHGTFTQCRKFWQPFLWSQALLLFECELACVGRMLSLRAVPFSDGICLSDATEVREVEALQAYHAALLQLQFPAGGGIFDDATSRFLRRFEFQRRSMSLVRTCTGAR